MADCSFKLYGASPVETSNDTEEIFITLAQSYEKLVINSVTYHLLVSSSFLLQNL